MRRPRSMTRAILGQGGGAGGRGPAPRDAGAAAVRRPGKRSKGGLSFANCGRKRRSRRMTHPVIHRHRPLRGTLVTAAVLLSLGAGGIATADDRDRDRDERDGYYYHDGYDRHDHYR